MDTLCANCGTPNSPEVKFCLECGTPMPVTCSQCGSPNPQKARFCGQCGTAMGATASATPASERRQLTVLFCDLVGSTGLSEKLDPEDFQELIQAYRAVCSEVISKLEGHVAQLLGDGVLAYFGYPAAHEDDARRAVEAALNILEQAESAHHGAERLRVRIGIHTGLVVVGGAGSREQQLALGEAPNIAARVQSEAEPGQVLISDATFKLVSAYFRMEPLAARVLKGLSRETALYRVTGRNATGPLDTGEGIARTPFTGRRKEMEALARCWEKAAEGRQTAHICGEPGMGKSRLITELKHEVTREGGVVRVCRCSPYHCNSALYPVIDLLTRILEFSREESDEHKMAKMADWLTSLNLTGTEQLPLMASLLNVASPDAPPLELTPQRKRQLTLETLQVVVKARAERQRLLFVVEDLHWADPSTVELIGSLAANLDHTAVLMLLSYRPEFQPAWPLHSNETIVQLHPLAQDEAEAMILRVGRNRALPAGVMAQIRARCEGVPLFVEEVTRAVLESGALRELDDRYEPEGKLPEHLIPATVRDSLTARMDRLGDAREVLRIASVLGREFDYGMLRAVAKTPDSSLQQALARAEDAQLIYRYGKPPESHYVFKHALIQDAAYSSLLKKSRQQYHEHVARTLVERFPETAEAQPELLAVHYDAAGDAEKAVQYWLQAGKRALDRAANREVIAHLRAALAALERLPWRGRPGPSSPSAGSDAGEMKDEEINRLELSIRLSLMPALMAIHGWASGEVEDCCVRARDLSVELADPQNLYGSLWGLWAVHFLRGEMDPALDVARQVLGIALQAGGPFMEITGRHTVGYTHYFRGEYLAAREQAAQVSALYDLQLERTILQMFQLSCTMCMRSALGASLWMCGDVEDARRFLESGLAVGRELNHLPSIAQSTGFALYNYHFWRDVARVREVSGRLLELSEREGFALWIPMAHMFQGWAKMQDGDLQAGFEQLRYGAAGLHDTGTELMVVQDQVIMAEGLRKAGCREAAIAALELGMDKARSKHSGVMLPETYRIRGEIRFETGDEAGAARDFEEAARIARDQSALSLELRAALSAFRLLEHQGRAAEGRSLVEQVYGKFRQGFDTPDLVDARSCMEAQVSKGSGE